MIAATTRIVLSCPLPLIPAKPIEIYINPSRTTIFFHPKTKQPKKGKAPDRLGGGNPGLGGLLRGLGVEEFVKTFSGVLYDFATYAAANFSESYLRRVRRSAAALR